MRWFYLILSSLLIATAIILMLQAATPTALPKKEETQARATPETKALIEQAKTLAKNGEWIESIRVLKKVRAMQPKLAESYLEAGRVYLAANQIEQAVEEWKEGLSICGENAPLLSTLGLVFLQAKSDPLAAMIFFKRAEKVDPKFPGLKEAMGETLGFAAESLLQKGQHEEARTAMEQALVSDPESPTGIKVRAQLAQLANRWEDAALDWEKVFQRSPTIENRKFLAEAHKRCGFLRLTKKEKEGAIMHFRRTVELAAEGVSLDSLLDLLQQEAQTAMEDGIKAFDSSDFSKAKERFAYSASLLPENPIAQNHLGLVLLKEGKKEDAAKAWELAISQAEKAEFDLGATPTHKNLALLYKELGKGAERNRIAQDYLKKFPRGAFAADLKLLEDPQ